MKKLLAVLSKGYCGTTSFNLKPNSVLALLVSFLLSNSPVFAIQHGIADSIAMLPGHDTVKIRLAVDAALRLESSDYDNAHECALWALNKSRAAKYEWGILNAYYSLASMEYENNNAADMQNYLDTLMRFEDFRGFQRILGDVYNLRGIAFYYESDHINALRYWEKALNLIPREERSGIYSNIGNIYLSNEKLDEALEHYLKAIEINKEINQQVFLVINYINAARCYTYSDTEQVYYLKLGEQTAREANYTRMLPHFFFDLSNYYAANNEFGRTNEYVDSLRLLAKEEEWLEGIIAEAEANYMFYLARYKSIHEDVDNDSIYLGSLNIRELYGAARDTYEDLLASSNLSDYRTRMYFHKQLADINTELQDYQAATRDYQMAYLYKDSMAQNQSLFQLKQLELEQEEAQKREAELVANQERQQQRNRLTIALILIVLVVLIAIGLLARLRFVNRTKRIIQKEKERSDELLHNILPAEVAAELKEKGESEAKDFDNVTVLFTDFAGFTQTAEKFTAKELVGEINTCFKAFDEIIQKYQIEKIKTIGDAYMAAGGLHVPRISEPTDVVNAALEMQQFMVARKVARHAQNLQAFDMRVGIHTGPVVAGIVGVKKFQYDIWGDTVNTANRMESNGQVGKVNISQATYELLKDDPQFAFESRGKIEAKGKGEMEMWFVSKK